MIDDDNIIDADFWDDAPTHALALYQEEPEIIAEAASSGLQDAAIPGYGFVSGQQYYLVPWQTGAGSLNQRRFSRQ